MENTSIIRILKFVFTALLGFCVFMILLLFVLAAPMALPTQSWAKFLSYFLPLVSGFFIHGSYSFLARKGISEHKIYGLFFSVSALLGSYIAVIRFYFLHFYFIADYIYFSVITLLVIVCLAMIMSIKAFKIDFKILFIVLILTALLVFSLFKFGNS